MSSHVRRWTLLAGACLATTAASAQRAGRPRAVPDYDDAFRKYSKRFFGAAFDWTLFKAQGMAESNLDMTAKSRVGARGVMQLMPSTFRAIRSENPELKWIDDPEMNIAAGVQYDRKLWVLWEADSVDAYRTEFMLGSYNAGRRTILRAQAHARGERLDPRTWPSIRAVAHQVPRWRHKETLDYIDRIAATRAALDAKGTESRPQRE